MNKRKAIILITPFLVIIFGVSILNFIKKDKELSSAENRNLQQRPTLENLKNRNFTTTYETYYTDQFIGRDKLLKLNTVLDIILNKSTIKDHYITKDNWILGKTSTSKLKKEDYEETSKVVNNEAQKAKNLGKEVYYVSLPHKVNTLDYMYPKYIDKSYGMENSDTFLSLLNKEHINTIDVGRYFVNNFENKELEKFYFKTDHHWNSIGAYEGFRYIINQLVNNNTLPKIDLNQYKYKIDTVKNKTFVGSYNRNLYNLYSTDEEVPFVYMDRVYNNEYYEIKDNKFEKVDKNKIINQGIDNKELNYNSAYTGDYPYYKIINKESRTNKKVLIVRDSYQAPLTWLFSDIFEEVEVIDPRHINMKLDDVLNISNSDIVMFMFNNGQKVLDMMNYIR